MTYGVNPYPPARESLHKLSLHFQNTSTTPRTLNGCLMLRYREKYLLFTREPGAIRHEIDFNNQENSTCFFWDQRFHIHLTPPQGQYTLKALGQKGWESLKKELKEQKDFLPYPVALTLPSLWHQDQLISIPDFFQICSNQTFTLFKENAIKFLPCYPLTRFTFTIA